jgi:hypothetical protein
LRLDRAGVRLRPPELGTHGPVDLDEILNAEIPDATVSR